MNREEMAVKCIVDYLNLIKLNNSLASSVEEEREELIRILEILKDTIDGYENNDSLLSALNIK